MKKSEMKSGLNSELKAEGFTANVKEIKGDAVETIVILHKKPSAEEAKFWSTRFLKGTAVTIVFDNI